MFRLPKLLCILAACVFLMPSCDVHLEDPEPEVPGQPAVREHMPEVYIETEGRKPINHRSQYVKGSIRIEDLEHWYSDVAVFEAPMQIRGRGNTTWTNFPKKPYKIRLDESASIFGCHKDKDWVLLANYSDKSLMRNRLGLKLSEVCGLEWTPKAFSVVVYLNDTYMGVYDLVEHKEAGNHKIEIDISKGECYLEIEAKKDKPVWFDTKYMNIPIMFNEPENPSDELLTFIKGRFAGFEQSLLSEDFSNPTTHYSNYIDVDSFINNYIVQEVAKNIDGDLFKSLFLVKRQNQPIKFCHEWDFDLAFGNCDYLHYHQGATNTYAGWFIRNHSQEGLNTGWYYHLFKDPEFKQKVKKRWIELYPQMCALTEYIDTLHIELKTAAEKNFKRWGTLNVYVWPNAKVLGDYDKEVEYLKDFYIKRLEWMNEYIMKF